VVLEPTGPSWLPIAVFFCARGHTVYRVSSAKAHDLRRVLSRHAKPNGIDADTLARLPLVDPAGLHPLQLPDAPRAALDRRVRACDRLTQAAACHKRRIKDLVRQLMPMTPLAGELGQADLAVLERDADPHTLVAAGRARLQQVIAKASHGQQGAARANQWLGAARAALELYADHPAVAFQDLAAEVTTELRLLAATQAELDRHAPPGSPPRPSSGPSPALPKASETGQTDRKGQPISKAGNRLLGTTLYRAADNARRVDPQLARIYYLQMVERGKDHLGAVCVVAAHLAERAWTVMNRGMPYVPCDTDGTAVTAEQAKQIIADHWTVPQQVRRRRRSKKGEGPSASPARTCHRRSRRNKATLPLQSWPAAQPRQASPATALTPKPP
jgi:transposase